MTQTTLTQTGPMGTPRLFKVLMTLARNDARLIGRDSFVLGMAGFAIGMAVLLRFALPWLAELVDANPDLGINARDYFPLLVGYMVVFQGAMLGGVMIGFILLDERDDNTLKALLVTPLPLAYYLAYRLLVPSLIAFVLVVGELLIVNQVLIPLVQLLPIAAVASLVGAASALFLASFASNKVEGFAMLKIIGGSGLLLFAAWFLVMPVQLLVGLFPPYWAVKAYWMAVAGDPNWPLALGIGLLTMSGLLALLVSRFRQVVYR